MPDINITTGLETGAVTTGLERVSHSVEQFKEKSRESFKEVAADFGKIFAATAVIEGIKELFDEFGKLQDLSDKLNTSAESLQRIDEAAKASGSSLDTVAKATIKVNGNAISAIKGNEDLAEAFKELGINASEFVDLPLEEKLVKLAEGYEASGNNALKLDAIMKVLGKSGAELIPVLAMGSEQLKETFANATVASNETVARIDEVGDRIGAIFLTFKSWSATAIGGFLWLIDKSVEGLVILTSWIENLPKGFAAAKEAADLTAQSIRDMHRDDEQKKREKDIRAGERNTGEQIAEAQARAEATKKATEDQKKAQDELAQAEKANADKRNEYHLRHITLTERELEIKKRLNELDSSSMLTDDKLTKVKNDNEKLDLTKELEKNQEEQAKVIAKKADDDLKAATRAGKEKARAEADAKREQLKEEESKLSVLEKSRISVSVDSIRSMGGGLAGVNYNASSTKDALQKQSVDLQKQTVEQLKKAIQVLEKQARDSAAPDTNFGFVG